MRYLIPVLTLILSCTGLLGQVIREGKVSYITSQHVYVKFSSMEQISAGDTLYIKSGNSEVPALRIKHLSSISCVCTPLIQQVFKVSDAVYANLDPDKARDPRQVPEIIESEPVTEISEKYSGPKDTTNEKKLKQEISGRLSVSSYSNFSKDEVARNQRLRYTLSMRVDNLNRSKLSAETYISFAHSNNNWQDIQENIFNGLKIYNLSFKYAFNETMLLSLGRKINPKLSSVGAIDGIQFEKKFGSITTGAIAGSRPDYKDYSINPGLFQYGAYFEYALIKKSISMQNTLAFIEQKNHSVTDRRFAYLQHTNLLAKNLFLFASAEVDLYKKVANTPETILDLSNTYIALRYRIIHPLSIGLSYSSRRNIIYYETYKDYIERLLEKEALQGWRFRVNYRPIKYMFIGINAGYRFQKEDPLPSRNLNGIFTYSQVPGIGASVSLSSTWIETSYLNGTIYSLGVSRDIISNKLNGGIKYRHVDYFYPNSEMASIQHVGEANISWAIYRKLALAIYYEGIFEKGLHYHRIYINISQRF